MAHALGLVFVAEGVEDQATVGGADRPGLRRGPGPPPEPRAAAGAAGAVAGTADTRGRRLTPAARPLQFPRAGPVAAPSGFPSVAAERGGRDRPVGRGPGRPAGWADLMRSATVPRWAPICCAVVVLAGCTSSGGPTGAPPPAAGCPVTERAAPDPDRPVVGLDLRLEDDLSTVTGTETVALTPDLPVDELWFRLVPNAPAVGRAPAHRRGGARGSGDRRRVRRRRRRARDAGQPLPRGPARDCPGRGDRLRGAGLPAAAH